MDEATPESECWLPVVGQEGFYEVSDLGRVRSLPRKGGNNRSYGGKLLRAFADSGGYLYVGLQSRGRRQRVRVHVLVAAAFIGPCPIGQEVRHWDGNRLNPRADNLLYGTRAENMRDMVQHRRGNAGKSHCPQGHEYTPENTRTDALGHRWCRRCQLLGTWKRRGKVPDSPRRLPAPRTHCTRGHELTPENTYLRLDNGRRQCRKCIRIRTVRKSSDSGA